LKTTTMYKDPYVYERRKALSSDFCKHLIDKFENSPRQVQGATAGGVTKDIKQSTDVCFFGDPDWQEEDEKLFEAINQAKCDYHEYINTKINLTHHYNGEQVIIHPFLHQEVYDTGYQIQRTDPGEFYTWHHDYMGKTTAETLDSRRLTFIWYLNDVKRGGWTEFYHGGRVYPEEGKLMMFPSTWTYMHRGYPPASGEKYICTGWIYNKLVDLTNFTIQPKEGYKELA